MIRRIIILAAVLLLLAAFRAYRKRIRSAAGSNDPNVFMPVAAKAAVAYASQHGKTLDYSVDSIKIVDALLGDLHDTHAHGNLPDKILNVRALEFGAYVGEVIRRQYGGSWATDHPVAGPHSFPLQWKSDSFPITWCGKRIINGEEDNVWFKFQMVTSDAYQKQGIPATQNDKSTDSPGDK